MRNIKLTFSALLVGFSLQSAYAHPQFNVDQLRQFHETNRCPNCDLTSITFSDDDLNHSGAVLHDANLSNAKVTSGAGINFAFADMVNANLTGSYLPNSNFSNANLSHVHFDGAYLAHANFYGAEGFDPKNAIICNAIMPDGSKGSCE